MIVENKPLIVLEIANNHQGDLDHGLDILHTYYDVCKKFLDSFDFVVKFQYRNLETFIHPDYVDSELKYVRRFLDTQLSDDEWQLLINEAKKIGFKTMCTPFDEISVLKVVEDKFDFLKIASASLDDWPLIEEVSKTDLQIIASVGGSDIETIKRFYTFMKNRDKSFALNYCVSTYPTELRNLNLSFISFLKNLFPDITIGFSTHEGNDSFITGALAYAQGARIFEKHIALENIDKGYTLNDYSSNPSDLNYWLENLVQAIEIIGSTQARYEYLNFEIEALRPLKRGVFASDNLSNNDLLKNEKTFYAIPTSEDQLLANDISKFNEITIKENIVASKKITYDSVIIKKKKEILETIRDKVSEILGMANIDYLKGYTLEISHHLGINNFETVGATLITLVNQIYCKKIIVLFENQENPEHFHKKKDETFILLYGDLEVSLDKRKINLKPGDTLHIPIMSKHSFKSINGAVIEEISSTHFSDDSFYTSKEITENNSRKSYIPLI